MKNYSGITFKYLKLQKKRTILTIIGIILSVTLITSIGTLAMSLRDKLIRETKQDYGDYHVVFKGISGSAINKIKNNVAVLSYGIISREGYAVINKTSEKEMKENIDSAPYRYLNIVGYDTNAMSILNVKLSEGRLPKSSNEIVLDPWILEYMETKPKIGDNINLTVGKRVDSETGNELAVSSLGDYGWSSRERFQAATQKVYTVVGFLEHKGVFQSNAFIAKGITFDDYKNINNDKKYFIYLQMRSMDNIKSKSGKIAASINLSNTNGEKAGKIESSDFIHKDIHIEYNDSLLSLYGKSIYKGVNSSMLWALIFIIVLIIVCTMAIIYNSFNISVLERISQYGILRCVGASPDQIRKIVYNEALFLSGIGIPIGLIIGTIVMKFLFYIIGFFSLGSFNDIRMVISPIVIILSGILGFLTVFISVRGPANQAAKVSPLEAVKNSGSTKVEKVKNVKRSSFIKYIFGIEGQFANRNIRRNKKRFRITAFSMIISIVLYIVTSGLMGYAFKAGMADGGKSYTYMLYTKGVSNNIDKTILKDIESLNSVKKIYPLYNDSPTVLLPMDKINPKYYELRKGHFVVKIGNSFRVNGCNFMSYGYQGLDELKKNLKSGTVDRDVLNKENGVVLINTSKLYTEKGKSTVLDVTDFKVGDEIEVSPESLTLGKYKYKKVKIVGIADKAILTDKYNENFGIIMMTTPEVYKNITGNDNITSVNIVAKPGISHTEITDYLSKLQKDNAAYGYFDNEKDAKENKDAKTIISILLYGFIFVILLIGCLNISNTISTNLILRTREFAVLKAIGMTKQAVKKMVLLEGMLYGLMSALYGTAIGTIIYYIVFKLLSGVEEITWTMPWGSILIAAAGSVLITLIWSLFPMRKINSGIISDDLRTDN